MLTMYCMYACNTADKGGLQSLAVHEWWVCLLMFVPPPTYLRYQLKHLREEIEGRMKSAVQEGKTVSGQVGVVCSYLLQFRVLSFTARAKCLYHARYSVHVPCIQWKLYTLVSWTGKWITCVPKFKACGCCTTVTVYISISSDPWPNQPSSALN